MSQDSRVGTQVGGYLIEDLLGRGGMGIVYLAYHERLDRKVALKVLAPEWAEDSSFRERFVRESRMAASLDHPNVIPVFDADEADGLLFIAMRYVDGRDLKEIITAEGPLDVERTALLLRQVAGALDAAHARGLVHRDVKPANILVTKAGSGTPEHAYLTDFGLTKHGSSQSGLTATGAFVGTIDYIAPEQIEGKGVDNRTDLYSLGCILFECLTGEIPFKKDADVAVMYAHLMDPRPSLSAKRPDLPKEIDGIVAKAMARDPDERYATGAAMVAGLEAALGTASTRVGARPPVESLAPSEPEPSKPDPAPSSEEPRSRRTLPKQVVLAVIALLVVAGAAFFFLRNNDQAPNSASGDGSGGAGGTHYVYFWVEGRGLERIEPVPGAVAEPLRSLLPEAPPKQEDRWVTTSPNGEWFLMETERLGCEGYSCLVSASNLGEPEVVQVGPEVVHTSGSGYGAITSDGETIIFPGEKGPHEVDLWAISRARIAWENPVLLSGSSEFNYNDVPSVSPDGTKVLFDCRNEVYDSAGGSICEVTTDGSDLRVVIAAQDGPDRDKDAFVRHGSYAPDGSIVFEAYWNGNRQIWRWTEGTEPELLNPTYVEDTAPCVLPDGTIASVLSRKLKLMSPDGVDVELLNLHVSGDHYVDSRLSCA